MIEPELRVDAGAVRRAIDHPGILCTGHPRPSDKPEAFSRLRTLAGEQAQLDRATPPARGYGEVERAISFVLASDLRWAERKAGGRGRR